ncbi:helix-turn-helix transcriptional regulator [Dactylosporangium sp. NPDC005572]|uniref:helix-turn-helix domain-containing protein n=1 Tax=Dactylosporangium sp. NPDC005572 TaxID=3156889 RepID=UPI00339F7EF5
MSTAELFGTQLRRRRESAGLSLRALAEKVHYDPGYVSKVETNRRNPSHDFVLRCDAVLGADGELVAAAGAPAGAAAGVLAGVPDGARGLGAELTLRLRRDGGAEVDPGDGVPLAALDAGASVAVLQDPELAESFAGTLEQLRVQGQRMPSGPLLVSVVAQGQVAYAAALAGPGRRPEYLLLAARFAEYAGWLAQEAGDHTAALLHTDRAERLALAAGDDDLVAYVWVRRAEMALYRRDSAQVLDAATEALLRPASARVHALALHRQAQGYALTGALGRCADALGRAAELMDTGGRAAAAPLGSSTVADLQAATAGWCYHDLGEPDRSAVLLQRAVAGIPATARRARGLFSARLALAHAVDGDFDRASEAGREALAAVRYTRSASTIGELRSLAGELLRHRRGSPAARQLHLELTDTLHGGAR